MVHYMSYRGPSQRFWNDSSASLLSQSLKIEVLEWRLMIPAIVSGAFFVHAQAQCTREGIVDDGLQLTGSSVELTLAWLAR